MDFDIQAMKQRAKFLLKTTQPKPIILGLLFTVLSVMYTVLFCVLAGKGNYIFLIFIYELLYMNFRNCIKWYALNVSREEQTYISDMFCSFKEKPVQTILLSFIKDILYILSSALFIVGILLPFYLFRFSAHIMKDEDVNAFTALGRSIKLLKGHYAELIKLDISNIGWCVLMLFTCGIAGIYVKPYLSIVYAEFYDYLKAQQEMLA